MKWKYVLLLAVICSLSSVSADACTLFAASGEAYVSGGGTIIAKNRDWQPEEQVVRLIDNGRGFRYYGLFTVTKKGNLDVKAGVNEKGLTVVSATAGSIPRRERSQEQRTKGINRRLLSRCATVDEALSDLSIFRGPRIIMLADRKKIAYIEVGPQGKTSVTVRENGVLGHTNHFIDNQLLWANKKISKSSATRYQRIMQLLNEQPRPFSPEQFIQFSEDKTAGANNSIWREGSKPSSSQTIGVFIVHLPENGLPTIYVKARHTPDNTNTQTYRHSFDQIFQPSAVQ